jgi:hypothetical protein
LALPRVLEALGEEGGSCSGRLRHIDDTGKTTTGKHVFTESSGVCRESHSAHEKHLGNNYFAESFLGCRQIQNSTMSFFPGVKFQDVNRKIN